jgi:hypothetical protein
VWAETPTLFVTGSEIAKDKPTPGYASTDLAAPSAPVLLFDVHDMISAHFLGKQRF